MVHPVSVLYGSKSKLTFLCEVKWSFVSKNECLLFEPYSITANDRDSEYHGLSEVYTVRMDQRVMNINQKQDGVDHGQSL